MDQSMHSLFQNVTNKITVKHHDKIMRFCAPLFDAFNINNFWFVRTLNSSSYSYLCSHAGWSEYWASEKLYFHNPFLRHPKCLREGIYLHKFKDVEDQSLKHIYKESFHSGPAHNQTLRFIIRTQDGIEEWGFSSHLSNEMQTEIFLNELPLFRLFIKKFKKENHPLIAKMNDNQLDASKLLGDVFFEEKKLISPKLQARRSLLKYLDNEIEGILTPREDEVIQLLLKGYSARMIASEIQLSKRTVEHHIERIKEKLVCYSKAELIQKAQELQNFGYFN